LSLSICGGEFEASRPVASALHFVLQFVEQPAEFGRVLLGARKFDRPILRVDVEETNEVINFPVQFGLTGCLEADLHAPDSRYPRFGRFGGKSPEKGANRQRICVMSG
jgi:hypothetical protein